MYTRTIESELLEFLAREVFAPDVPLTPETNLVASGFDSMSLVRVLLFIEGRYGFWIPESEITTKSLQDARSLAALVTRMQHDS